MDSNNFMCFNSLQLMSFLSLTFSHLCPVGTDSNCLLDTCNLLITFSLVCQDVLGASCTFSTADLELANFPKNSGLFLKSNGI